MSDITNEQILESLNSNEELRSQFLEGFSGTEYGKGMLDEYANNYFESKVGAKIGEVHGMYDKDLADLGIVKPDGVKSYEFVKSTIKDLQEKAKAGSSEALAALKAENDELRSKIESNEDAKYFKDLWEGAQKTLQSKTEEYENQISTLKSTQVKNKVSNELKAVAETFEFNPNIPKSTIDTVLSVKINALLNSAKVAEDGTTTYYDENGEIILNGKTAQKATASEILRKELKDIIAEQRKVEGGGADGGQPTKSKSFAMAKTQGELRDLIETSLKQDGYLKGTDEFQQKMDELYKEHKGDLPLR